MARNVNVFIGGCKAFENKGLLRCSRNLHEVRYHSFVPVKNPCDVSALSGT